MIQIMKKSLGFEGGAGAPPVFFYVMFLFCFPREARDLVLANDSTITNTHHPAPSNGDGENQFCPGGRDAHGALTVVNNSFRRGWP